MSESRSRYLLIATLVWTAWIPATADYSVTDLVVAARTGDAHAVHRLVVDGADIQVRDSMGYTALHWAAIRGHWGIFSELVAAGGPINAVGGDGSSPLHWACYHDRPDMIALLLDTGANQDLADQLGQTPLHIAARRGCREVVLLLSQRGAEIEAATDEGCTPLHLAYRSEHPEVVRVLVDAGADTARLDDGGLTPIASLRPRPRPVEIDPRALAEYQGIFDLADGQSIKVWLEGDQLRIRDLAPDGLYPIGKDLFFCLQEPRRVAFQRNDEGAIVGVRVDSNRRSVVARATRSPRYVGSRTCRDCHSSTHTGSQYVAWVQSRHAHAYWRLRADWALFLGRLRPHYQDLETPATDSRCVLCHVTGAQDDNALFAQTFRTEEGVGCESCHGPGSDYIDPEVMSDREAFLAGGGRVPDESTCRSCHRNSERFEWAAWWPKIAHPSPNPAQAPGT